MVLLLIQQRCPPAGAFAYLNKPSVQQQQREFNCPNRNLWHSIVQGPRLVGQG
ncbi:hypothetical protein EV14_3027 [Prochlorococcus sp. MIT 0703]|nr:hypothetical protein EV12_0509 [Prochlorococcus sp. MIT 0701]KGG30539.1 hypothetical protein EV14_3027 [Prochlorococcus sp. MIT 0703]